MSLCSLIFTGCFSGLAALVLAAPNAWADDPKVVRTTLSITDARFGNYWANPKAKEPSYNTWSWLPRCSFWMQGDMPPGADVSIEYMLPDGRPWITVPLPASKIGETNYYAFGNDYSTQEAGKPAKTIVGTFPFKIHLKNPLDSTNKVVYAGKYTVSKFHKGNALPAFKNQFEYVVDQDWRLPYAYLSEDGTGAYSDSPTLQIKIYLKGKVVQERLEGVLYYKGTMIGSKELRGGGFYSNFILTTAGMDTNDPLWSLYSFEWGAVRMRVPEYNRMDSQWYLTEHPGEYEMKLLRNGQLNRSIKFTIGADGKVVDGGMGAAAKDVSVSIVPVKVLGTADGKWNPLAWKNGAFYGNPLPGFVAP